MVSLISNPLWLDWMKASTNGTNGTDSAYGYNMVQSGEISDRNTLLQWKPLYIGTDGYGQPPSNKELTKLTMNQETKYSENDLSLQTKENNNSIVSQSILLDKNGSHSKNCNDVIHMTFPYFVLWMQVTLPFVFWITVLLIIRIVWPQHITEFDRKYPKKLLIIPGLFQVSNYHKSYSIYSTTI